MYAITHHISSMLPWQIQFGLFRFRSPLLAESRLISLPRPTQMLHFGRFALPSEKQGSVKRDLIRTSWDHRSHAPTPGLSQLATSFFTYQAESSSNRRLCTSFSCIYSYIYEALNLYANTGKDALFYYHIDASVVIDKIYVYIYSTKLWRYVDWSYAWRSS